MVAQRDRLARFGFELIQWLVQQNGNAVLVLNQQDARPRIQNSPRIYSPSSILSAAACAYARTPKVPNSNRTQDKNLSHNRAEADAQDLAGRQPLGLQPHG